MQCKSLLCVSGHVAWAQADASTYVYFEILLVCSLAWEKTVAVVNVFVVGAIGLKRGRSTMSCGGRALGELVGLIMKW